MKQRIGEYLLRRLEEAGIQHLFGVPGDYNLELMQQLEDRGRPEWIGNCNELNASYAADGYARIRGLAALVVTNGVGALSAANGIAGAFAEHVPVICICGSLPLKSIARNRMMHHTPADGSHDNFYRVFTQITVAQTKLTPANAAAEVDRLIQTAWQTKRPVYLELPSDIAYLEIPVSEAPLVLTEPESDAERLRSCTHAIVSRLEQAHSPALLLDADADRFGVLEEIKALAETLRSPVATLTSSKGTFSEWSPLFAGIYFGAASKPSLRKVIEESDCLITVGLRRVDSTSGFFTDTIPATAIHLNGYSADIGEEHFEAITLRTLLESITQPLKSSHVRDQPRLMSLSANDFGTANGPLTQAQYWKAMQDFIRPGDIVIAEDGTSSSGGTGLILPDGVTFVTQAIWGSIGYTLGALLGTLIAAPERRQILFIGDGSFQLTVQELSTMMRHGLKPFIFLINNGGYTIERTIQGKDAKYNDVANWAYADLPKVFSRKTIETFVVRSRAELQAVLDGPHDDLVFVESLMNPHDAPVGLIRGGHASADTDYGPRGPQFAKDAQIELPEARSDPQQLAVSSFKR